MADQTSFGMRWGGHVSPRYAQTYTFTGVIKERDERVRVWIDDIIVVDQWTSLDSLSCSGTATFSCPGGADHKIMVEYHNRDGSHGLQLKWSTSGTKPPYLSRVQSRFP
jgi:hypothetical protein